MARVNPVYMQSQSNLWKSEQLPYCSRSSGTGGWDASSWHLKGGGSPVTLMETKDREGSAAAGQEQRSEGRDRAQDPLPTGTPAELSPADSTTSARLWGGHPLPRPCCWHSGDTAQGCQGAWRLSKRAWQVEEASVKKKGF